MINLQTATFFLILIISANSAQLKFVIELYRHGARYAVADYWDGLEQKQNSGELLPAGMRQHFVLGKTLREEYIDQKHFLSPQYNHSEIHIRSTDFNRTLMSAMSQLYGLYPSGTGPNLPEGIQPQYTLPPYQGVKYQDLGKEALPNGFSSLPIHTVNMFKDNLLLPFSITACPKLMIHQKEFEIEHALLYHNISKQFASTFENLAKVLNISQKQVKFKETDAIFDVFISDLYQNRPLPEGLTQELFTNLTFLDDLTWFLKQGTRTIQGLNNHHMFNQFIDYLDPIVNNKSTNGLKWVMFSAHDSTVAPVMAGLNFSDYQCLLQLWNTGYTEALNCEQRPFYAANIIIELYQEDQSDQQQSEQQENLLLLENGLQKKQQQDQNYFVMVKYNGKYMNLCEKVDTKCNYVEFKNRLLNSVFSNQHYEQLCYGGKVDEYIYGIFTGNFWIYLCTAETIILFALIYIIHKKKNSQKNKHLLPLINSKIELTAQSSD